MYRLIFSIVSYIYITTKHSLTHAHTDQHVLSMLWNDIAD
jgi:hypothetical protein